jgi:hypothetical protein
VRSRLLFRFLCVTAAVLFLVTATLIALPSAQQAPANPPATGQGSGARGGGGGGGGQRAAAANPLLSQPAPRMPDGTINLGRVPGEKGVWGLPYIQNMGARNIFVGAPAAPPRGEGGGGRGAAAGGGGGGGGRGQRGGAASEPWVPFQPWAAAVYDYNSFNESKYDPEGYCLPPGGPRMYATPYPMEIIQQPEHKRIIMIFEGGAHVWREIYMDGRPHAKLDAIKGETWLGDSVGRWEGDTLVVDIVGFNEGTWLDYFGHPHTTQLHVIEKFTRPNKGTLHYEATIDDPGAYTKPWTVAWDIPWREGTELQEYICQENNVYLNTLKDDFGNPIIDTGKE